MERPGSIDAAAAVREADIHQNHVGIICGSVCDCSSGRCRYRANVMTKVGHKHCEIHSDQRLVLDDEYPHGLPFGR